VLRPYNLNNLKISKLPAGAAAGSTTAALKDLYEAALRSASSVDGPTSTPSFTTSLAETANFTDFCQLALPDMCAEYYSDTLGQESGDVELQMSFRQQFLWGKDFDKLVYERPLLSSLSRLAGATDPTAVEVRACVELWVWVWG